MKKSHLVTHSVELLQQKRALLGVRLTKSHKVCLQHWYASVWQHSARFSHEETRGVPQHSLVAPKCHQKVQRHLPGFVGYGAGEGREWGKSRAAVSSQCQQWSQVTRRHCWLHTDLQADRSFRALLTQYLQWLGNSS